MLGAILIFWSAEAIVYLVVTTGILFIILGLIPLILHFARNRETHPEIAFPYTGLCFLIFGMTLAVAPQFFVNALMYILGIVLVVGGVQQIVTLTGARKWTNIPAAFYILPALIVIAGIFVFFNPFKAAENLFILTGAACLIYGIADFANWLKFRRQGKITF
jgi:uncharacterized membrane protein HdeD (DUF308 family)